MHVLQIFHEVLRARAFELRFVFEVRHGHMSRFLKAALPARGGQS